MKIWLLGLNCIGQLKDAQVTKVVEQSVIIMRPKAVYTHSVLYDMDAMATADWKQFCVLYKLNDTVPEELVLKHVV